MELKWEVLNTSDFVEVETTTTAAFINATQDAKVEKEDSDPPEIYRHPSVKG